MVTAAMTLSHYFNITFHKDCSAEAILILWVEVLERTPKHCGSSWVICEQSVRQSKPSSSVLGEPAPALVPW
jgi:hypothetical protein